MSNSDRGGPVDGDAVRQRWLAFTVPIVALVSIVSVAGLVVPELYRGEPAWTVQAVAQDFVDLVFVVPVLVLSAWLAAKGSRRAWLVWLGVLTYLVYTFVIYAFAVQHNRLFIAYVATLGCSLWALIGGMAATDWVGIAGRFAPEAPTRWVSLFLGVPAVLFGALWLAEEVPAMLSGTVPASIEDAELVTNPVHVLDLAVLLPAMLTAAVLLWRRRALGYGLAEVLLVNLVFQNVAIAGILLLSARAGLPGAPGTAPVFAGLAVVNVGLQVWYMRGFSE
jgi:hypothetical protein